MDHTKPLMDSIKRATASSRVPIAIFSASWPIARQFGLPPLSVSASIGRQIVEWSQESARTILLPAFTSGYGDDGVCDLDFEPANTGLISECFRQSALTRRTLSAFFSFAVVGPGRDHVSALRPRHAWGKNSVYDWLVRNRAQIITIGLHPTHNSVTHYAEYIARDLIKYRTNKHFQGIVIREGKQHHLDETLFVRKLSPEIRTDFRPLLPFLLDSGMEVWDFHGIPISCIESRTLIDTALKQLQRDPDFFVAKNLEEIS